MRRIGRAATLLLAVGWTMGSAAAQPAITLGPGEALLSVEATGVAYTRPDTMAITASTVTTGATATEAVQANAAMAQRMIAAVRSSGIEPRDIRTTNFTVEPRFEGNRDPDRMGDDGRPPRIVGYVVENQIAVRLRDLSRADRLITALFEAGANSVRGPTFSLADGRAALRAAERAAIEEARAEAENYAAAAGRRLGRVVRISDRRSYTDPIDERIIVTGSAIRPTPIEPGEVETEATVFVDYVLAPQ